MFNVGRSLACFLSVWKQAALVTTKDCRIPDDGLAPPTSQNQAVLLSDGFRERISCIRTAPAPQLLTMAAVIASEPGSSTNPLRNPNIAELSASR